MGGRGDDRFLQTREIPYVYVHTCIDSMSKQFNEKLKIISATCISSIQGHTSRLINGITNKRGPQCKTKYSPSTLHQISPETGKAVLTKQKKNDLLEHWGQKDVENLILLQLRE